MLSFREYLLEDGKLGRLSIFDIDSTLFNTTAVVKIVKDGEIVKILNTGKFNTYHLKPGEEFDFSEFRSSEKFWESTPIDRMLNRAKAILSHSVKNPLSRVIILTARANFDDKEKFRDKFRHHNFDIDKVRVERAGNIEDIDKVSTKKYIIIHNYLRTGQFDRCSFFDDDLPNLTSFLNLRDVFPNIKFEAYLADKQGGIKMVK